MNTIAIIGCGAPRQGMESFSIAHAHAQAWLNLPEAGVELYAVDIKQDNLTAFAQKFGLPANRCFTSTQALYEAITPDVVSICTWPALHHPQVIEAAGAGVKGIVCEKPVALDADQMQDMLRICTKKNCHLAIAHQRRYEAQFERARELIQRNRLGDKLILEARVAGGWDVLSWTVHWFDMACFLLDDEPVRILSGMDVQDLRRYGHAVENSSVVFIEFSQGHQALFITGPASPLGEGITLRGSKGELRLHHKQLQLLSIEGNEIIPLPSAVAGYGRLFADLLDVIAGRRLQTRCSAPQGLMGTRLALAAQESARTRRAINLSTFHTGFAPLEVLQHAPMRKPLVRKAVLLADAHHFDSSTGLSGRDGLHEALLESVAQTVYLVPADERELNEADLLDADLLVIYHTQQNATPAMQQIISRHVESSRPMLVVHCGIGAYAAWPAYRQWLGRYWVWSNEADASTPASAHPHLPCVLKQAGRPGELPLPWDEAWLPRDEVYTALGGSASIHTLATMEAPSPDGRLLHQPAIWRSTARPNVVVTLPGHRPDLWALPAMRAQLRASAQALLSTTHASTPASTVDQCRHP